MISFVCTGLRKNDSEKNYRNVEQLGLSILFTEKLSFDLGKVFEVSVKNESTKDFEGVIEIAVFSESEIAVSSKQSYGVSGSKFFMPGFMYNRNTADMPNSGRKRFPRLKINGNTCPESDYFMTRSDRLALPVSLVFNGNRVYGIAGKPFYGDRENPVFAGFSCRLQNGKALAGYSLGYEHAPWFFLQTANVFERVEISEKNSFKIKAGEEFKTEIRVYDYEALLDEKEQGGLKDELAIHKAIKDAYSIYHEKPRNIEGIDVKKATKLLTSAIRDYAWIPEDRCYTGFVYDKKGIISYNKIQSLSWTNGFSVAGPMLLAANRLGDEKLRTQALTFIEEVITNSFNEKSGLPYDALNDGVWSVYGWWYNGMHSGGHSTYLAGQAVFYLLKDYISELELRNEKHDEWLEFAKKIIYRLNTLFNSEYEYPFSVSDKTGAALEYDSMGGVWCLAATLLYRKITNDESFDEVIAKSEQHYYDKFVSKVECYGGPLDTDKAVDDEGILPYARAAKLMHEIFGEEKYLDHLRDGLYYEFTFKLGYNTPVQVKPLKEIGWSSCGGSITSVANPHIHPMSNTIVDEMIYYLSQREDDYIRLRLEDTIGWGLQTFNTFDKEYGHGKIGWMSERFCFCEGLVTEKYEDGTMAGTWFALMPWASSSIVEGFVGEAWNN